MRRAVAVSLFELGRIEDGEAEFEALLDEYPDYGWACIRWGDMYRESYPGGHDALPSDDERAAQLYRTANSLKSSMILAVQGAMDIRIESIGPIFLSKV